MTGAAVLGWALRTSLGARIEEVASRVLAGKHGEGRAVGEISASRHARFLARLPLLALDVAHEAVAHAAIAGGDRCGVFVGVGGLRVDWDELAPALEGQQPDGRDVRGPAGYIASIHSGCCATSRTTATPCSRLISQARAATGPR